MPQEAIYHRKDQPPQLGEVHLILEPLSSGAVNPLKTPTFPRLEGRRNNPKSETFHVGEAVRLSTISAVPTWDSSSDEDVHLHLQKNLP